MHTLFQKYSNYTCYLIQHKKISTIKVILIIVTDYFGESVDFAN